MTSHGPEDLLWEIAGTEGKNAPLHPAELELLSDERLEAYRSGELGEDDVRRLEKALSASPAGRARLVALAALALEQPSEAVRRRVLEAAPGASPARPHQHPRRRWWLGAAAAVLAAALLFPSFLDRSLPQELVFDVTAAGRPPARSVTLSSDGIPSLATTRVTILVEPRVEARSGLEFGLYRVDGSRLRRLDLDPAVKKETGRGTARFSALAQDLVDSVPGPHEIYVAVAREGDLPPEILMGAGTEAEETLAARGRRRVYRQVIQLLSPEL